MDRIVKIIKTISAADTETSWLSLESFLRMASVVYGGYAKLRQNAYTAGWLRSRRLPCVVVSIGNLAVGGTGKTPMTLYVAQRVQRLGYHVVVLSRGYKGRAEKTGGIVSDGCKIFMDYETAGDEPYMMATRLQNVPVVVGRNRFETGMLAVNKFNPEVMVLDDAFQHLKLLRDLDLVLLDYRRPFGNMHLLPRGGLREPPSALLRGDAFVLTRSDAAPETKTALSWTQLRRYTREKPVFKAFYAPEIKIVVAGTGPSSPRNTKQLSTSGTKFLRGRRIFAFSGLADNSDFHRTVAGFDGVLTGSLNFADHHPYSPADFEKIIRSAKAAGADCLVTSEKDFVRIARRSEWPMDLAVIGIECAFDEDQKAFDIFLQHKLEALIKKDH